MVTGDYLGRLVPAEPPAPFSEKLLSSVVSCDPKPLLIIDSLIGFFNGQSENDSGEMRRYMQAFRKLADLGCTGYFLAEPRLRARP